MTGSRRDVMMGSHRLATWVRELGGPRVLLAHGWSGHAGNMNRLADALVANGYSTVQFDGPAHGESEGTSTSPIGMAEAIRTVAEATGPIDAVVAHSMGAASSLLTIAEGLAPRAVVLIGSPRRPRDWIERFATELALPEEARRVLIRTVEQRTGVPFARLELDERARTLDVPALFIHDRDDDVVSIRDGERLHAAWPGATAMWTEGLGHRRILRDANVIERTVAFVRDHTTAISTAPQQEPLYATQPRSPR
jgi:pimeloyl-ACP methyl ester carboxylesterase